jgi:hypothetical protein
MSPAQDALTIALLVTAFAVLRRVYFRICRLPDRVYRSRSIVLASLRRSGPAILGVATAAAVGAGAWAGSWDTFEDGSWLRLVVATSVTLLAWTNATYEINAYYAREHLIDRGLVLMLGALVWVHPAFTPAFLLVMMPVWRQVTHPSVVAEAITDKLLVVDVVIAFSGFVALRPFTGAATWHYMVLAMGLVGTHYFHPGWCKVTLGPRVWSWALCNRLSDLTMNAWVLGHLGFLSSRAMSRVGRVMRPLDAPIQCVTLAVELAAIGLLADRAFAVALLLSFVVMHGAILLAAGLAFWKWSAVDLALVAFLVGAQPSIGPLFSPLALGASATIVALGRWHSAPAQLGWFDSRLVETFRYEVVGRDGRVYALPNNFCAPYDQAFSQGRFAYLYDRPGLVATHGVIRPRRGAVGALALRHLIDRTGGDPGRIERLRRRYGTVRFDEASARRFDSFLRSYFGYLSRTRKRHTCYRWLPHPKHFWHWTRGEVYRMQVPVAAVRIRYIAVFTEPGNIRTIEDRVVREVMIELHGVVRAPGETACAWADSPAA